ncbi:FAD synthetase [Lachnospiraceae bacterium YSD2013]|jgi:riboflavin kinase/FMN adenylyltransferase|nr:FAD synthetase [Lachnospiraceae bacterium YSD2013]
MIVTDGLSEIEYKGRTRVVIGKFDGIHAGHQKLIRTVTEHKDLLKSVVFTFTFASEVYLNNVNRILSEDERRKKFEELGTDYLVEYELNDSTARMEPEEFARVLLRDRLHAAEVYCGPDLSFGYKGRGNVELLRSMEEELGIKVIVIDKVKYMGEDISSTRIREAIKNGNMTDAENMLRG